MRGPGGHWSDDELALLRARYATDGTEALAALLGRTPEAVRSTARRLKVAKAAPAKPAPRPRGRPPGSGAPDGRIRTCSGYQYIKTGGHWRLHHHVVWEQAHGPLPDGHVLAFRDGNTAHVVLDNLELVSKAAWLRRYDVANWPPELAALIDLKRQLTGAINRRVKTMKEKIE